MWPALAQKETKVRDTCPCLLQHIDQNYRCVCASYNVCLCTSLRGLFTLASEEGSRRLLKRLQIVNLLIGVNEPRNARLTLATQDCSNVCLCELV